MNSAHRIQSPKSFRMRPIKVHWLWYRSSCRLVHVHASTITFYCIFKKWIRYCQICSAAIKLHVVLKYARHRLEYLSVIITSVEPSQPISWARVLRVRESSAIDSLLFYHIFRQFCTIFVFFPLDPIFNHLELRICLIQLDIKENLTATLDNLATLIERAVAEHRPRVIALPEGFNFHYETVPSILKAAAEPIAGGKSCEFLSAAAKKYGIYIVGGTIVEQENDKLYNTCTVWNPNGELIARYRKVSRTIWHFLNTLAQIFFAELPTICSCSFWCSCALGSFV